MSEISRKEAIKNNNLNEFNSFLKALSINELAEMLSAVHCDKCICHCFCNEVDNHLESMTCQETIKLWLEQEVGRRIEISREEHIKELKIMNSLWGMTPSQRRAVVKAISDMQKLEKIEEALNQAHNNSFIFRDAQYILDEIEQIVRGEDNGTD